MRLSVALFVAFAVPACRQASPELSRALSAATYIDLSHPYDEETVYWPTADGFVLKEDAAGYTEGGFYYTANSFSSAEHGGTHLDAPIHFAEGKWTTEQIPMRSLVGPAAVVDVSTACRDDADYEIGVADLLAWEAVHGPIPDGAILLLVTGYSKYWPDRERYMGTAETGPEAVPKLHFPGLHPDAARWLTEKRRIAAAGIDTPSIDRGQSVLFESHRVLFEANVPALENVARPERLPPLGAWIFALPMKIKGGSGGPVRIVAVLP